MKYFSGYKSRDDDIAKLLRLIPSHDMLTILNSIKFNEKHEEMIIAYITIINDILLELLMDPSIILSGSFHFGSMVHRGGKTIFNILVFMIKNFFQQLSLLKIQFCPSARAILQNDDRYLASESSQFLVKRIKILNVIIENCLYGMNLNPGINFEKTESLRSNPVTSEISRLNCMKKEPNKDSSLRRRNIPESHSEPPFKKRASRRASPKQSKKQTVTPKEPQDSGNSGNSRDGNQKVDSPGLFGQTSGISFSKELHKGKTIGVTYL